jgi:hypothetical protein
MIVQGHYDAAFDRHCQSLKPRSRYMLAQQNKGGNAEPAAALDKPAQGWAKPR